MMSTRATGTFIVKELTHPPYEKSKGAILSRVTITKRFEGELQADGVVRMLRVVTKVPGSAGYVAIERVTGTLQGRIGSFFLQHSGTTTRGVAVSSICVVPDSGTGALEGIAGTMTITVADGKYSYVFEYTLG
jgi:hypothetical protein